MRPDGSDPVRLTTDPLDESAPHWSTSGSRIAFSVGPSNVVHVMNADGTGRRSLGVEGTWPSWSPDDARIVFHSRIDDQIWIVNADGSGARALTALPVDTGAPSFSPDGRSVIFHSPRTGPESRLWIVDPDGGAPRLFPAIPDPGLSHATWIAP
jgi:TolB protein